MIAERWINLALVMGLVLFPLGAHLAGEPFLVTLATKAAILALAGVGLNIALGLGGLVSLGHAAFFGIGGYAMGVLASHAQAMDPILAGPVLIESIACAWLASTPIA